MKKTMTIFKPVIDVVNKAKDVDISVLEDRTVIKYANKRPRIIFRKDTAVIVGG